MDIPAFLLGFIAGMFFIIGLGTYCGTIKNLEAAQSQYLRCISDGGTPEHCVEKYLLPEKEPKP